MLCFSEMCALLQKLDNSVLRLAKLMEAWQHLVSDIGTLEGYTVILELAMLLDPIDFISLS